MGITLRALDDLAAVVDIRRFLRVRQRLGLPAGIEHPCDVVTSAFPRV